MLISSCLFMTVEVCVVFLELREHPWSTRGSCARGERLVFLQCAAVTLACSQDWAVWYGSVTVELLCSPMSEDYPLCFCLWLLYWLLSGLRICFHVREVSPSLLQQIKVSEIVPKSRLCGVEDALRY